MDKGKTYAERYNVITDENGVLDSVSKRFKHTKVNLRVSDIKDMIETYECLKWQNKGTDDAKDCSRIIKQLKKSINVL